MASTKPIKAKYSPKLDGMTTYIRNFFSNNNLNEVEVLRIHKGIADFCYKNSSIFKKEFLTRTGIQKLKNLPLPTDKKVIENFMSRLSQFDGECIFLLKDTFDLLNSYQQKTGKGYGVLINRNFLCRSEEDYFSLINLIYNALAQSTNINDFSEKYFIQFRQLLQNSQHFLDRAKKLFMYVNIHTNEQKIIFVDLGFQFTISLFCSATIRYFGDGKKQVDFYSFSAYPWLQKFFKDKYFSKKSEVVLELELKAIKHFQNSLSDKAAGALVGFAIGDALGFPVAGIDKKDISKFIDGKITSFAENKRHPFFFHLQKGQYTENTKLMIISAEHLIKNDDFVVEKYQKNLVSWGKEIMRNPDSERWAGPTTINSVKELINGKSYHESGSTITKSCSATYRVIPLGIFYRPLTKDGIDKLKNSAETSAMITHNSHISKTGAIITALIIGDLMHGVIPEKAVLTSLIVVGKTDKNKILIEKIQQAVDFSKTKDIKYARKEFGTGSLIYQTLPLAIFCFLKFQDDFEKGIIAATNSYRNDSPKEKERLQKFSWDEQLQYAKGGNTDGIAGLTGAFIGAHLGKSKIPKKFLNVENEKKLESLGNKLL